MIRVIRKIRGQRLYVEFSAEELSIRLSTSYVDIETDEQSEEILATWRKSQDATAFIEAHHPTLEKGLEQFRKLMTDFNREG